MADVFDPLMRSYVMSRIRGKGNKRTELALIHVFRQNHITGWRRNSKLFGRPDFVFAAQRVAVFVDGCFWHGCPAHFNQPVNNADTWAAKIDGNKRRDLAVTRHLTKMGWKVLRIWEHELKPKNACKLLRKIEKHLGH